MRELIEDSETSKASKAINFRFSSPILTVERNEDKGIVHLKNNEKIEFDLLIECTGFRQNQKFNGLQQDDVGRFITNSDYLVSDNIYTCGWARTGPKGNVADSMSEALSCAIEIYQDLCSKGKPTTKSEDIDFMASSPTEFKII